MKTSKQLKALIRNLSKKSNVEAEILLRNFMMERFLERIAISDYKNNFILKGGMLIAMFVKIVVANLARNLSPDLATLPSVKTNFGLI